MSYQNELYRTTSEDKKGILQHAFAERFPLKSTSGYFLDKYKTVLEAILEYIRAPYDLSEVEDGVAGGIQNAVTIEKTQDELNKKASRELLRYLKDEQFLGRKLVIAPKMPFAIGGKLYFQGPHAIAIDNKNRIVETIRYKSSSATGMTRGVKGCKPGDFSKLEKFYDLYADIQYVWQNIHSLANQFADGKPYEIQANYYFLKKTNDSSSHFDLSFFEGGNSVVGLEATYIFGAPYEKSELDELFEQYASKATNEGFECNKDNCRYCNYKAYCLYNRANVKQDVRQVKPNALGTPSETQKAIIDAATDLTQERYIKVNAGAGTGKTFTMVYLIITLLKQGYDVRDIFIASYTNAGVTEIRQRIAGVAKSEGIPLSEDDICCSTFDSFYYGQIAEHYAELGLPSMPKLLKADVQQQYIEELLNEYPISEADYGRMNFDSDTGKGSPWIISAVSRAFNAIQTYHIDPDASDASEELIEALSGDHSVMNGFTENSIRDVLNLYKVFDAKLHDMNVITYSHLQGMMDNLLKIHPTLYKELGYKYIIIDEFQDSNEYQVNTIRMLSGTPSFQKLIVVGDDAQSIYGFRDTTPEYIIHFAQYMNQPVKDMYLLENRRSTPEIIDLANKIIALNENRVIKDLIPMREHGSDVFLQGFHSKSKEREFIVDEIVRLIENGTKPEDICVIDRKRSGLTDIGTRLTEKGIPWVSKVGQNLLDNSKVKAALSLCDAFYDPDVTVNYFNYVVAFHNGKVDEIPDEQIQKEIEYLKKTFSEIDRLEFSEQRRILHDFLDKLKEVEDDEIYEYFLELLYDNEDLPEELEYSRIFKKYGSSMEKKLDQSYVGVTLVTAHSSKGMEWPIVFNSVTNYDSSRLHRGRSSRIASEIEETLRLLFVSTTRARDTLYLTGVYVAYGSEKEGYTYNQFLNKLYGLLSIPYDPVDHEKEERKARKAAARKVAKKNTSSVNLSGQKKLF